MVSNNTAFVEAIMKMRDRYISEGRAPSYYEINNGLCDDFASDVIAELPHMREHILDVANHSFMMGQDGDETENDIFDIELLKQHWPKVRPLHGLTWDDINSIDFGLHVWMVYEGRHYDAECPHGVENFFSLPLFQVYINDYIAKKTAPTT